jgi:peptide/nickel transport system ATP-binding protein
VTASVLEKQEPARPEPPKTFLEVRNLKVHFPTDDGLVKAVDGLSFNLEKGKTLASSGSPAPARASPACPSWACTRAPGPG